MDSLVKILDQIGGYVWGPYLLIPLLLGVGVILMAGLRFMPLRRMPHAFVVLWRGRKAQPEYEGEISPFRALMTSLAPTVGTGNIVGVATAILLGGPGAVFWMWMTALFGMATKFCEATLAVKYREVTPDGKFVGGPMYYIKNGLGPKCEAARDNFGVFAR
jgi:AGCS family alanine or glycine:cation symporter